jgi:hypothetical protein
MGMAMANHETELHQAFEEVYLDLCAHGICRYDPDVLAALWAGFLRDMAQGFASLFEARSDEERKGHQTSGGLS